MPRQFVRIFDICGKIVCSATKAHTNSMLNSNNPLGLRKFTPQIFNGFLLLLLLFSTSFHCFGFKLGFKNKFQIKWLKLNTIKIYFDVEICHSNLRMAEVWFLTLECCRPEKNHVIFTPQLYFILWIGENDFEFAFGCRKHQVQNLN